VRGTVILVLLAASSCGAQTEAENLIEAGHWKRARAIVEANARQSHDALTQFLLSQIHNAFGDRESPLPLAEKAVALDGNIAKYHRQVAEVTGVMAQHAGFLQQILLARRFRHEIDTALSLDARDVQGLRDLMEYYLLAPGIVGGDKDKAREIAARIARVDAVQGYLAQARLAEVAGELSHEEAMLRKAVETGPSHYRARVALAAFLLSHGNGEAARQEAAVAEKIDSTRVDAYAVTAAANARLGHVSELESLVGTAEKQVPDDLSPYFRAAEVLLATGQELERAQRYLRRYMAAEPEGNAPSLSDARAKLEQVLAKTRSVTGTRASVSGTPASVPGKWASVTGTRASPSGTHASLSETSASRAPD
jgi:tetratricopeptide (TPR) repeat protein